MKTRAQKEQQVTKVSQKLEKAKSVVFTDYQGLTTLQLNKLRGALKPQQAEFAVTKNTLLDLSLKEAEYPELPEDIRSGPIATLFAYDDEIIPIKALVKALKDAGFGKIKAGFLGKNFLDETSINRLAALPGKTELQGKLVGMLASPLYGIVGVLQANIRNLVYAVDAIRIKRGGE